MLCPLWSLMLLSNLCAFFCYVFVFSLGTGDPAFPCYSCSFQCLNFSSGSNFACLMIRTALSSRRVFCIHLFFSFSHSSTLTVITLQFVLLPSVQLSHASIIKFMKSRPKNILLLKNWGLNSSFFLVQW